MQNLFDSDNYPNKEPSKLVAGERWAWTRSDITAVYPTASYTLMYLLILQSSAGTAINLTAGKTGSAHVVEVGQSTTNGYGAGDYKWQAIVVRDSDSEEVVVDEGYVSVSAQTGDVRSHVLITLQAIRATIEGTATKEQASYSIAGRSLSRRSVTELLELENVYLDRWEKEKQDLDRENGRSSNSRVLIQMEA